MYFPIRFDIDRAIELGELVEQAYTQFEASYTGKPWKLPTDYTLIKELSYLRPIGKITIMVSSYLAMELRGLPRASKQNVKHVPMGFIVQRKECIYLIFRGTISDQEWFHNLKISLAPYLLPDFGKVHDGFLKTYNLFRTVIKENLDGMDSKTKLFIAGHSLGGALATIALPDIGVGRKERRSRCIRTGRLGLVTMRL